MRKLRFECDGCKAVADVQQTAANEPPSGWISGTIMHRAPATTPPAWQQTRIDLCVDCKEKLGAILGGREL